MSIAGLVTTGSNTLQQQLQLQQSRRNADQAASSARALQSQAREARLVADRADSVASGLESQASQAQAAASQAKQNIETEKSFSNAQNQLADVYSSLPQKVAPNAQANQASTPSPNSSVGTLVNTTA